MVSFTLTVNELLITAAYVSNSIEPYWKGTVIDRISGISHNFQCSAEEIANLHLVALGNFFAVKDQVIIDACKKLDKLVKDWPRQIRYRLVI